MVEKWSLDYPAVNGWEKRNAYVYLPVMYEEDPQRRFPVLYMFDGQNLFWDQDATYGKSWGLEKFLDENRVPLMVAALECNTGVHNERLSEYSPYSFVDRKYGQFEGKGDATLEWFMREFKPFIDQNGRTLPDREHTFIGGSSMGGLMSLYALFRYNEVFSRAAALSPSLWVAPEALTNLVRRTKVPADTVLYMDYGSEELANHRGMRRDFGALGAQILTRGVALTQRIVPGGTHSEASWERQLPLVFESLLYGLEL